MPLRTSNLIRPTALCLGTLALTACGEGFDGDGAGVDPPPIEHTTEALQNGTATTGFAPVVRIRMAEGTHCTATAISDSVLLTASHCLKDGHDVTDHVEVAVAHGANSSAVGATSSYVLMSADIYDNVSVEEYMDSEYTRRDLALIKFGAGTFDAAYRLVPAPLNLNMQSPLTQVGFGGDTQKHYGVTTVKHVWAYQQHTGTMTLKNGEGHPLTEGGDSGGPVLVADGNGSYSVFGALYGEGTYPIISRGFYNYITPVLDDMDDRYCVQFFEHTSHQGDAWAACFTGSIQNQLDRGSFSEPWKIARHDDFSHWNDEISSVLAPPDVHVTLFEHSNAGGDRVTVENLFEFGSQGAVGSLVAAHFNDKMSSYRMVRKLDPSSASFHIEITRYGKCLDLDAGQTHNGANLQQWSCQGGNDNQVFKIVQVGDAHQIKHAASGKCLDVAAGNTSDGTNIQLWGCNTNNQNQLFTITENTHTADERDFTIRNVRTHKCVDLAYGGSSNGTNIHQWWCNNGPSQNFAIEKRW